MPNFKLNFNPDASEVLGRDNNRVEFRPASTKLIASKYPSAKTMVRTVSGDSGFPFSPAEKHESCQRYSTAMNEANGRELGLRAQQRYTLAKAPGQRNGWMVMVPHSKIVKSKAKRIEGPGVSVSLRA